MSASKHQQQLGATQDRTITVGLVQKQIKVGSSQADVATVLGSPNIVTGDSQKRETWIYDKVATEASFSQDNAAISSSVTGNVDPVVAATVYGTAVPLTTFSGTLSPNYSRSAGATSITQRTLTVVIKFNPDNLVESVSYNSTKF